jgi:hypothetical protein
MKILFSKGAFVFLTEKSVAALAFPPPLRGRDREGGQQQSKPDVATPLPTPPPQGGREPSVLVAPLCGSSQ